MRLERVTKQFGDVAAVDDLSLDIEEGEFFSLLGPSGCGKTTTLRMIGGFEDPTYGTVYLGGRDVTEQPPYKRDVNTVFQSYALFPHLNVFENVAFGLRRRKVGKDEVGHPREGRHEARRPRRLRGAQAAADVGRPAAAGRAGPRPREPPEGPAPGRAARRARPEAAQADAARAQTHPAGGRDHVHLRDPRPGRSHDDVQPVRGDASGQDRTARRTRGRLREPGHRVRRRVPRRLQPAGGGDEGDQRRRGHGVARRRPGGEGAVDAGSPPMPVRPSRSGSGPRRSRSPRANATPARR